MRRLHVTLIIIITVLITLLANILVGDYIAARLATLPLIRKLNILQPRAPIVINNRETLRVSDANDAMETTNGMRTKMASLVYFDGDRLVQTGSLLNWTADGYFITTDKAFSAQGKTYAVVLNSGDVFPVKNTYADTASTLILVETDAGNVPNIDTVDNKDLRPGTVCLPKGLWRRSTYNSATSNALVPDSLTDLGGGACFNDARVQVAPLNTRMVTGAHGSDPHGFVH